MGAAAKKFEAFFNAYSVYPKCPYENMRGSFQEHIAADWHRKRLWWSQRLQDDFIIEEVRENLWQEFSIGPKGDEPPGAIRFNHADGAIEMSSARQLSNPLIPTPSCDWTFDDLQMDNQWIPKMAATRGACCPCHAT